MKVENAVSVETSSARIQKFAKENKLSGNDKESVSLMLMMDMVKEDGVVVGAGAKILGPFTVHKGAKVGSNAVVTKEVPEGVTAVGNPARYIFKDKNQVEQDEANRRDYAESIGFQPYATTQDQSDPILEGIRVLLDRMQKNEKRMNILCQHLSELDPTFKPQGGKNQPLSKEELKIIEEVRRECEAQSKTSTT